MKKLFLIPLFLTSLSASALEWEAGIRETFVTVRSYTYNSDSSARIYRDMFDRGHRRISIQPRLAYAGDERSVFFHPAIKSSFDDVATTNARTKMADGKLTIKPLVYDNPGLGEAKVLENINPKRPDLALTSYSQMMGQYLIVARNFNVDRVVVGSGIVHLLENTNLIKKFENTLKGFRLKINPQTKLVLEISSDRDLKALDKAIKEGFDLISLVDGVSIALNPERHFPNGKVSLEEVKSTRLLLDTLLPGLPVHLSRVVIPGCKDFSIVAGEYYCSQGSELSLKNQVELFKELKRVLVTLETEGIRFGSVEILETNSDFEPTVPDHRYPYFNPLMSDPALYELPVAPPLVLAPYPLKSTADKQLACVYYDKNDAPPLIDRVGDIHSIMLESNLGAFKNWRVKRYNLSTYYPSQMNNCDAIFYLGTNFMQEIPTAFLNELAEKSISTPVVWFNYKLPYFITALQKIDQDPAFNAEILMQPDTAPSPTNSNPGFFRWFDYKGETFSKLSEWNPLSNNFSASTELHKITLKDQYLVEVLASARHTHTNQSSPYAVRSGNIWYFADSPFSFVHYEDRYFIFADLLWDILSVDAPTEKIALARVEDVAPNTNMEGLKWAIDYFAEEKVPFSLAVIPYYNDMVGDESSNNNPIFAPITKYPELTALLRYAKANNGSMIMHGVSHAVGSLISGYDGISGSDYEFWLYPEDKPLPFDSITWLTERLDQGIKVFQDLGLKPAAFEIPHYAASAMNYMVFAKMFRWNYHRSIYFPFEIESDTALPEHLQAFNCKAMKCGEERRAILQNIKVKADYSQFAGIPIPYIVWKDAYGQAVIPETLGMIDFAFYSSKTWRPISAPEDILRRAKKLRVIRGAMASFFWHPHMLNPLSRYYQEVPGSFEKIGGKNSLRIVVKGLKELGYTFKSIDDKTIFPDEDEL